MSAFKNSAKAQNVKMGECLKAIRNEKNITMRSLASVLGTPHSFVGKIEQQTRRMDVGEFTNYCRALEVDPVFVFSQILEKMNEQNTQ